MVLGRSTIGLLALGLLTLTACSHRLDTTDIAARIQADIERQGRRLSLKGVRCPTDVTRQGGAYFRCVGELDPEGTFTINVIQQDSQGTVTWEVPNSKVLLNLVKVEASLQQGLAEAIGKRALVDCGPATYRVNQPGDRFECQVVGGITDGTDTIHAVLVRVDSRGNLDWQELRTASQEVAIAPSAAGGPAAPSSSALGPSTPPTASSPSPIPAATVTGPTGRPINRPYVPGDDD